MKKNKTAIFLILLCLAPILFCFLATKTFRIGQKFEAPRGLKEAQEIYQNTSWYWSHAEWNPENFPGFDVSKKGQVCLWETNRASMVRIYYNELEARRGLFCFRGKGVLTNSPQLQPPLFELKQGSNSDVAFEISIVGFVKNRMFWINADGENEEAVLTNAHSAANSALAQLRQTHLK